MEIKVREVNEVESKSTQQVEQELLDKHEAEVNGETAVEDEVVTEGKPAGLSEDEVRSNQPPKIKEEAACFACLTPDKPFATMRTPLSVKVGQVSHQPFTTPSDPIHYNDGPNDTPN